jgi:nitrite reductase/ring-hydroxylating ferredoxin subunit
MIEGNYPFCGKRHKIKPQYRLMDTLSELPPLPPIGTVLCHRDDVTDGQVILRHGLMVLRSGEKISAFINRCTHFGVPLAAKESQLIFTPHEDITCNIHYARFRWEDGSCESGECQGEGLVPVFLQENDNGDVCVLCY